MDQLALNRRTPVVSHDVGASCRCVVRPLDFAKLRSQIGRDYELGGCKFHFAVANFALQLLFFD